MPILWLILCLFLLSPVTLFADETEESFPKIRSIALPGQSAYIEEGISFGLAGGVFNPVRDCDCMGLWQTQLEYYYSDWVSGGLESRFFGGDLDKEAMVMYQRYRLNIRFHRASENGDFFVGTIFGLETTNISELRNQVQKKSVKRHWWEEGEQETSDSLHEDVCKKLFSLDGFTAGIGMGGGYNLTRLFSVTGLVQMEYNFSNDVMLNFAPGFAFNLHEVWPWARRTLRSMWITFEIGGQRSFNRDVDEWSNVFLLGFQLGV